MGQDQGCEGLKWAIYNKPELKSVSFAIHSLMYSSKVNLILKTRPPSSSEVVCDQGTRKHIRKIPNNGHKGELEDGKKAHN